LGPSLARWRHRFRKKNVGDFAVNFAPEKIVGDDALKTDVDMVVDVVEDGIHDDADAFFMKSGDHLF
jgi:hypothetical protein